MFAGDRSAGDLLSPATNVLPFPAASEPSAGPSGKVVIDAKRFEREISGYARPSDAKPVVSEDRAVSFEPDGLYFRHAIFPDLVSLVSRRLGFALYFFDCEFAERFDARWAELDALTLKQCILHKSFEGIALTSRGNVDFTDSKSHSQIDLSQARIQSDVVLVGARLECDETTRGEHVPDARRGAALFCGGLRAHSLLMDRMICRGRIFLDASRLSGILKCANVTLERDCKLASQRSLRWNNVVLSAADTDIDGAVILGEEARSKPSPESSFESRGQVNLSNSHIGGDLICTNAVMHSPYCDATDLELKPFADDGHAQDSVLLAALNLSRTEIGGGVWLDGRFSAHGEVRFDGAHIRGAFRADGATIDGALAGCGAKRARNERHRVNLALNLERAEIGSSLLLNAGFRAFGRVLLRNATIHGDFVCQGGEFHGCWLKAGEEPLDCEAERQAEALNLSGATIEGSAFLVGKPSLGAHETFTARGQVRLRGTQIKRNLHLGGGQFRLMPEPNEPSERRPLEHSRKPENLSLCSDHKELPLIGWFHRAQVLGTTFLKEIDRPPVCFEGSVSFAGMQTGGWEDSLECWPQCRAKASVEPEPQPVRVGEDQRATFELNGLTYQTLRGPTRGEERVLWLLHQPMRDLSKPGAGNPGGGFKTQPWEQCARVLYELGYQRDARYLYRMQQRFIRIKGRPTFPSKALSVLLGIFVGHGYRVFYTFLWAIWLVGMGMIVTDYGYRYGYIVPAQSNSAFYQSDRSLVRRLLESTDYDAGAPVPYPKFHPLLFSLDTALPAGDLRQKHYWIPTDTRLRHCPDRPEADVCPAPSQIVERSNTKLHHAVASIRATLPFLSERTIARFVGGSMFFVIALIFLGWLFYDMTIGFFRDRDFNAANASKLYRRVLNHKRGWGYLFPAAFVVFLILLFIASMMAYLYDAGIAFDVLRHFDKILRGIGLNVSVTHIWTTFETLVGWLLITAVVVSLGSTVFRRRE
ncbi:MAG TPA: hypothetical protein VIM02_15830 [Rhizomicrobium sp.]